MFYYVNSVTRFENHSLTEWKKMTNRIFMQRKNEKFHKIRNKHKTNEHKFNKKMNNSNEVMSNEEDIKMYKRNVASSKRCIVFTCCEKWNKKRNNFCHSKYYILNVILEYYKIQWRESKKKFIFLLKIST